ncbi:MAG: hypothetical protein ACOYIK_09550 [Coriobacteriales bacterium]|jgi:hypothetical protein
MRAGQRKTRTFKIRLSESEYEKMRSLASAYELSAAGLVSLLLRFAEIPGRHPAVCTDPILFDTETSHRLSRELRSVGTLYNQSVAALNTIAKAARECPGEAEAEEIRQFLSVVEGQMEYVIADLDCIRQDVSGMSDRPALFLW